MKDLIKRLETLTDFEDIKKMLSEIGAELLTKHEIRVNNITIKPLRVEPYFFKPKVFEDKFIHRKETENGIEYGSCQRNRFGKLYIHKGFTGVDIVLSNSEEYAFSFLIKNSRVLIDNEVKLPFAKQYDVAGVLKDNDIPNDYNEVALYERKSPNDVIVLKTIRNGLTTIAERSDFCKSEQDRYSELMISSFVEFKDHSSLPYVFVKNHGKLDAVAYYLVEHNQKADDDTIIKLLGFRSNEVKQKYEEILKV